MKSNRHKSGEETTESVANRVCMTADEAVALIDQCLTEGNIQEWSPQLWHHVRAVLQLASHAVRELAPKKAVSMWRQPNPDAVYKLKKHFAKARHDRVRANPYVCLLERDNE
jgi:hypothetical protein